MTNIIPEMTAEFLIEKRFGKKLREFTRKELEILLQYLYLGETWKEGSGVAGSAWEALWKEFRSHNMEWNSVVNKVYKVDLVNITSTEVETYLRSLRA